MGKDERIMKIEQDVKELTRLQAEVSEKKVLLETARKKAEESRIRSELYSKLEKVSGVELSVSTSTCSNEELPVLEQKIGLLLREEADLKKQILSSFADKSVLPFGLEEPVRRDGNTMFATREEFLIESDVLKTLLELVDLDYPCRFDGVIIDEKGIIVENEDVPIAIGKAADSLERLRARAKTMSETLFDESKLKSLCEIVHSGNKSYRPIVEEIGKHYPNPISTREIANARNMKAEAVSSITSMLSQGRNWKGKCSILKRTKEDDLTYNSLGVALWCHYQKLYSIPQKPEQRDVEDKQRSILNFSEK